MFGLRIILSGILTIAFSFVLQGKGYFDFHTQARLAYQQIFELRLEQAQQSIEAIKQKEPNNDIVYHLEDYVDFMKLYCSEDPRLFKQLTARKDDRLQQLAKGDPASPYFLYTQAEVYLHWALLSIRFESYFTAFRYINKAYKLLVRNQELHPSFLANKKDLGILHAAAGTVPDNYKWALHLLSSLEGSIEQGKAELEYVLEHAQPDTYPYMLESHIIYSYFLLQIEGKPKAAWQALQKAQLRPDKSPLQAFALAHIAMRTANNDAAIRALKQRPTSSAFYPFAQNKYLLGLAKLRRLDTSGRKDLESFVGQAKGRNFIKAAYQKIAWSYLLEQNPTAYRHNMQSVLKRGVASIGGDKNAQKEAEQKLLPNMYLLKARLLFDGGYYEQARQCLRPFNPTSFFVFTHQLEFTYRQGRIYQGMDYYDQALNAFNNTIAVGKNNELSYACNAALQAGLICEKRNHKQKAKSYFQLCLEMAPVDYKTGLHQQAKAGLLRLKKE